MKKYLFLLVFAFFCSLSQAAELFVQVKTSGQFFAVVGDQSQFNPRNQFRFFDLYPGQVNLQIMNEYNNQVLFNGYVNLEDNRRLIIEIDNFGNISKSSSVEVVTTSWFDSYIKKENNSNTQTGNNSSAYANLLSSVTETAFDAKRMELAKKYTAKSTLTVAQIAEIAQKFTFESNRLEWAKHAYHHCSNKENYFELKSVFTFSTNYDALEKYVSEQ